MQKTSVAAFMSKYCRYAIYRQDFADMILVEHITLIVEHISFHAFY